MFFLLLPSFLLSPHCPIFSLLVAEEDNDDEADNLLLEFISLLVRQGVRIPVNDDEFIEEEGVSDGEEDSDNEFV